MPMPNMMTPQAPQYPGFPGLAPGAVQGLQYANQLADYNHLMQQTSQAQQMGLGEYGLDIEKKMLDRPMQAAERENKMGQMQWENEQRNALRRDPRVLPAMVESKIAEAAKQAIENRKTTAEALEKESDVRGRMLDPIVRSLDNSDKVAGLSNAQRMYEEARKSTPGLPEFNPSWIRTNHAASKVVMEAAQRMREAELQATTQVETQKISTAGGIKQAEIQGQTQRDVEKMRGENRIALEEHKGALANQIKVLRDRVAKRKATGGHGWTEDEKADYLSLKSMIINLAAQQTKAMGETLQGITNEEAALQAPNTPNPWDNETKGTSLKNNTFSVIDLQIQNHPKREEIEQWKTDYKKANPNIPDSVMYQRLQKEWKLTSGN
jgi:hypothetical protein